MKRTEKVNGWVRSYEKALRDHMSQGYPSDMKQAERLGLLAVTLGLETLELANAHRNVMHAICGSRDVDTLSDDLDAKARLFFLETLVPIERTHQSALHAKNRVNELANALRLCKLETAAAKRSMQSCITRRVSAEAASREIIQQRTVLLRESDKFQKVLRDRLRKLLVMQEAERRCQSSHLCDEIGQSLLALDLGLISLKESGKASMIKLTKDIGEAEGLVRQSGARLRELNCDRKKT